MERKIIKNYQNNIHLLPKVYLYFINQKLKINRKKSHEKT